jgi:hypothetical protein
MMCALMSSAACFAMRVRAAFHAWHHACVHCDGSDACACTDCDLHLAKHCVAGLKKRNAPVGPCGPVEVVAKLRCKVCWVEQMVRACAHVGRGGGSGTCGSATA